MDNQTAARLKKLSGIPSAGSNQYNNDPAFQEAVQKLTKLYKSAGVRISQQDLFEKAALQLKEAAGIKFIKVEPTEDFQSGTSKKGTLIISYHTLVELFGEPQRPEGEDVVRVEWSISMEYQHPLYNNMNDPENTTTAFVNIYDWKQDSPVEDVDHWNVGAKEGPHFHALLDYLQQKGVY